MVLWHANGVQIGFQQNWGHCAGFTADVRAGERGHRWAQQQQLPCRARKPVSDRDVREQSEMPREMPLSPGTNWPCTHQRNAMRAAGRKPARSEA
jgi:hypothetical protein